MSDYICTKCQQTCTVTTVDCFDQGGPPDYPVSTCCNAEVKMSEELKAPNIIYLIPDGEFGFVWCEDPAPGVGMEEDDAIQYTRHPSPELQEAKEALEEGILELERHELAQPVDCNIGVDSQFLNDLKHALAKIKEMEK